VQPGDKKPAAKTITQAADSGTQRELLVALRTRVAKAIESADTLPRDLAALTRRLQEITRDIEAIDAEAEDASSSDVADEDFDASAL
jgi:hypothetical protein